MLKFVQAWMDKVDSKGRIHFTVEVEEDVEWENPYPDYPEQRRLTFVVLAKLSDLVLSTVGVHMFGVPLSEHAFSRLLNCPVEGSVTLRMGKVTGSREERLRKRREGLLDELWDEMTF